MKRSRKVAWYKNCWCGIAGSIEDDEGPKDAAIREICEETNLKKKDILFVRAGEPFCIPDVNYGIEWKIHPFLFNTKKQKVFLDWESEDGKWINPRDIFRYRTTPKLDETLRRALGWRSLKKK